MNGTHQILPAVALIGLLGSANGAAAQRDPGLPGLSARTRERLELMQEKLEHVTSIEARFQKHRFTPLLRKPLVSEGRVRAVEGAVRWDTLKPSRTVALIESGRIQLYDQGQKRLEIYPHTRGLEASGFSLLPRLDPLREQFDFHEADAHDLLRLVGDQQTSAERTGDTSERYLGLRLVPKVERLREHMRSLTILLDTESGCVRALRMDQAEGEKTVYLFQNVRLNPELSKHDLDLEVPKGTTVVHPYGDD